MRFNFRMKIGNITSFFMISQSQRLEGFTSKVIDEPQKKHLHYTFWDLEVTEKNMVEGVKPRTQIVRLLSKIQRDFKLGDIYIFSDAEGSYRAWCWSKRPWIIYLHILLHSFPLLDYGFWVWTVRRGAATLRTSNKINRPSQKLVAVLKGYEATVLPKKLEHVIYDTGIEKRGKVIGVG